MIGYELPRQANACHPFTKGELEQLSIKKIHTKTPSYGTNPCSLQNKNDSKFRDYRTTYAPIKKEGLAIHVFNKKTNTKKYKKPFKFK